MAMYIPADGSQPINAQVMPENGRCFSLHELYRYTNGGPIELLHLSNGRVMVCNEEAKLQDQVVKNVRASEFVVFPTVGEVRAMLATYAAIQGETVFLVGELPEDENAPSDYIAGDVLICETWEIE